MCLCSKECNSSPVNASHTFLQVVEVNNVYYNCVEFINFSIKQCFMNDKSTQEENCLKAILVQLPLIQCIVKYFSIMLFRNIDLWMRSSERLNKYKTRFQYGARIIVLLEIFYPGILVIHNIHQFSFYQIVAEAKYLTSSNTLRW